MTNQLDTEIEELVKECYQVHLEGVIVHRNDLIKRIKALIEREVEKAYDDFVHEVTDTFGQEDATDMALVVRRALKKARGK